MLGYFTPEQWADVYHSAFNLQVFFGPAIALVVSYTRIYFILRSNGADLIRRNIEATYNFTNKRMMKALKMSIVHCALFVLFWTPYTVMATWYDLIDLYPLWWRWRRWRWSGVINLLAGTLLIKHPREEFHQLFRTSST